MWSSDYFAIKMNLMTYLIYHNRLSRERADKGQDKHITLSWHEIRVFRSMQKVIQTIKNLFLVMYN